MMRLQLEEKDYITVKPYSIIESEVTLKNISKSILLKQIQKELPLL